MPNNAFYSSDYCNDITLAGIKTATAGTAAPLTSTTTPIKGVYVQALAENTGLTVVGGSNADETAASRKGMSLAAGESIYYPVTDLAKVYIDVAVSDEGVNYVALRG